MTQVRCRNAVPDDPFEPQTPWVSFGPFTASRVLGAIRVHGVPLPLDGQGFQILATLVERRGSAVTGAELVSVLHAANGPDMNQLWEVVASINLVLHASAPSAGHVAHHPSAGFSLFVPVAIPPDPLSVARQPRSPISRRLAPIFGRDEAIGRIISQVRTRRFVTVVGPGGMGKTTVALAAAEPLAAELADGACFVDLAPLADGQLVEGAIATALGVPVSGSAIDLVAYLRARRILIILDSCEHVVSAAASLVESLLAEAKHVHVLATSREPLRASGEWLYRLGPISLPARAERVTAAAASLSPGVQMFVDRARAAHGSFELTDAVASTVVDICRRFDGIPLAIELAAPRVALLGVQGLARQVEERLLNLPDVRREVPRRHRTIERLLDWSYDLLSVDEQCVLRRLSAFRGTFTLASVSAVVADEHLSAAIVTDALLDLVAKSLVTRVEQGSDPHYRLLDTTRAYMAAKLAADPDEPNTRMRHALFVRQLLMEAETAWDHVTRPEWRAIYAGWVNDVRAALDWAFSSDRTDGLALELTSLSLALADQTSLMTEFVQRTQRALEVLRRMPDPPRLLAMRLSTLPTFQSLHQNNHDKIRSETSAILRALELAKATGAPKYQAGPLTALWVTDFQLGHYAQSMRWSLRMSDLARDSDDPIMAFIATRTAAQTQHFLGRHDEATRLASDVLANATLQIPLAYFPSAIDCRVSMRIVLARSLWMQGRSESAARVVDECIHFAQADTPPALCQTLTLAGVPIAIWCGDWALARQRLDWLADHHHAFPFAFWQPWCQAFLAVHDLRAGIGNASQASFLASVPDMLGEHLPTLDSRLLNPTTLARAQHGEAGWCAPEVLRLHAEGLRERGSAAALAEAGGILKEALALAHAQGALAWELRVATSLADLWKSEGRLQMATDLLSGVRRRFVETRMNADLKRADILLQELVRSSER